MNAEFIAMLDYLERERGIKREILLEAVSNALLSASKKSVSASRDLHIDINPKTGEIRALANLMVVDHVGNPQDEIELSKARKIKLQHEASSNSTGTDTDVIFWTRGGIPSALVSLPNRYMHSPVEMINLKDLEQVPQLLAAFARTWKGTSPVSAS